MKGESSGVDKTPAELEGSTVAGSWMPATTAAGSWSPKQRQQPTGEVPPMVNFSVDSSRAAPLIDEDSDTDADASAARRRRLAYYICLVGFFIPAVTLQVSLRATLNLMKPYQWFVFQSGIVAFCPLSFLTMLLQWKLSSKARRRVLWDRSLLGKSALMAGLDGLATFCVVVGSSQTTMSLQTLIPQAVIPLTMLLSYLFFKEKFNCWQISGASCIILASAVVVFGSGLAGNGALLFVSILAFSNIPMALSACYKQAVLTEDTGVMVLSTYITVFQIFWGFAFTPLNALPGMGGSSLSELPEQITGGSQCLVGIGIPQSNYPDWHPGDCQYALLPWLVFIFSVFGQNVAMLGVVKFGSASASFVVYGVSLPIANAFTAWPWLMEHAGGATPLTAETLIALVVCCFGLILYSQENAPAEAAVASGDDVGTSLVSAFTLHSLSRPRLKVEKRDVRVNYISRVGISPLTSPEFQRRILASNDPDLMRRMRALDPSLREGAGNSRPNSFTLSGHC